MNQKQTIALAGLGVVAYLAWRRGLFGGQTQIMVSADEALEIGRSGYELDACGNSPIGSGAYIYASGGVETGQAAPQDMTETRVVGQIGAGATKIAAMINPIAGAVTGIGAAVAAFVSLFSSSPPDPVFRLIIAEMPFDWTNRSDGGPRSNATAGPWYAVDRCGYLHELPHDFQGAGYIPREVVAINWKVFQMLPQGEPIGSSAEVERIRMPRPASPDVIRRVLGNDARFYTGQNEHLFGPWDPDAHLPPLAGSPAMWAEYAGEYEPTLTASPGDY